MSSVPSSASRFPVDRITLDYLRSLKPHNPRDCTFDYVTENAQFFMGPINLLLPCVLVGTNTYWRDSQNGGREKVNHYFFRMAGMTERLDHLGMVEKVYMNDSSEDAMLQTAYVPHEADELPKEFVEGWIAIDKTTKSVTSLRAMDDSTRKYFVERPNDYHVADIKYEVTPK